MTLIRGSCASSQSSFLISFFPYYFFLLSCIMTLSGNISVEWFQTCSWLRCSDQVWGQGFGTDKDVWIQYYYLNYSPFSRKWSPSVFLKALLCRNVLKDVTAAPFLVSFSQLPSAKNTQNNAAVTSLRSFLFRDDFSVRWFFRKCKRDHKEYTGSSRLMRISLLWISLLRFFKTITKIWLMRFYGLFILLLRT